MTALQKLRQATVRAYAIPFLVALPAACTFLLVFLAPLLGDSSPAVLFAQKYWFWVFIVTGPLVVALLILLPLLTIRCPQCKFIFGSTFFVGIFVLKSQSLVRFCPHCGVDLRQEIGG
jgi:hypothetical protein